MRAGVMLGTCCYQIFLLVFILSTVQTAKNSSYYVISAPGSIYSGRPYGVVVALFNIKENSMCELRITGPKLNVSQQLSFTAIDSVKYAKFQIPELERGNYELSVRGVRGLQFQNSTELYWQNFKSFIHIQAGKTHYKPGELLQFRVLWFDELLIPVTPEADAQIWINDAQDNRIKSYEKLNVVKGVFESELSLAQRLVLGSWRICARNGQHIPEECAYFDVKDYVVPTFKVNVISESYAVLTQKVMNVSVQSDYVFGGSVEGNVTLQIETFTEENVDHPTLKLKQTAMLLNGSAQLAIPLENFSNYLPEDGMQLHLMLDTAVEERYTGIEVTQSRRVMVFPFPYVVTCLQSTDYCKHFLREDTSRELSFLIKHMNASIVDDNNALVKLIYKPMETNDSTLEHVFEGHLKNDSRVDFEVKLPPYEPANNSNDSDNNLHFDTYIEYKDLKMRLFTTTQGMNFSTDTDFTDDNSISEYDSTTEGWENGADQTTNEQELVEVDVNYNITAAEDLNPVQRGKAKVEKENFIKINQGTPTGAPQIITFNVSDKFENALCVIMVNGHIFGGQEVKPDSSKLNYKIKIQFTMATWPIAMVFFYGIDSERNLLFMAKKSVTIEKLPNKIVAQGPTSVSPGQKAVFKFRTTSNSFIGVMAVEESAVLFDKNSSNDLSMDDVERLKYQMRVYALGISTGENEGLVTLASSTLLLNAHVVATPTRNKQEIKTSIMPRSKAASSNIRIRTAFPDVWIFQSIPNTKTLWSEVSAVVPDSITRWKLTAFSMHPTLGLGLLDSPLSIVSSKKVYMTLSLPYFIRTGEMLRLPLVVFNKLNEDLNITISLEANPTKFNIFGDQYEILDNKTLKSEKTILIPRQDTRASYFEISANSLDPVQLTFTATSKVKDGNDKLRRQLNVDYGGFRISQQVATFRNMRARHATEGQLDLELPQDLEPTSIECYVSGHLLGSKLRDLLQFEPFDNAEAIITKLLNVFHLWDYLQHTTEMKKLWLDKIHHQLSIGYQSLLRFRHNDGGFCYFPPKSATEQCSSTWLSAYAAHTFRTLETKTTLVEERLLQQLVQFLLSRKQENETHFIENENAEMPIVRQLTPLELTMEVLEAIKPQELPESQQYVESSLQATKDTYLLVKSSLPQPRLYHWMPASNASMSSGSLRRTLETAGHMLLHMLAKREENRKKEPSNAAMPLFRWLVSELYGPNDAEGSYESSVGQRAIFEFGKYLSSVTISSLEFELLADGQHQILSINDNNSWKLQRILLPPKVTHLSYLMRGKGQILLQCAFFYDKRPEQLARTRTSRYKLNVTVERLQDGQKLRLQLCVQRRMERLEHYVGSVLELQLPTGHELSETVLNELNERQEVQHFNSLSGRTRLDIKLRPLRTQQQLCLPVLAIRTHQVRQLQPGILTAYDVNGRRQAEQFRYKV